MKGTLFAAGLCFFDVAAIVAGLLPQLAPGMTQQATLGVALVAGAVVAAGLGIGLWNDQQVNH